MISQNIIVFVPVRFSLMTGYFFGFNNTIFIVIGEGGKHFLLQTIFLALNPALRPGLGGGRRFSRERRLLFSKFNNPSFPPISSPYTDDWRPPPPVRGYDVSTRNLIYLPNSKRGTGGGRAKSLSRQKRRRSVPISVVETRRPGKTQ